MIKFSITNEDNINVVEELIKEMEKSYLVRKFNIIKHGNFVTIYGEGFKK